MVNTRAILQSTPEHDTALGIADYPWDGRTLLNGKVLFIGGS